MKFWEKIERLHKWERVNLPCLGSHNCSEVLVWLMQCHDQPKPLKHLYRASRTSEPTLRACIYTFLDKGLLAFEINEKDLRTRYVRPTEKFLTLIREYELLMRDIVAFDHEELPVTPPTHCD